MVKTCGKDGCEPVEQIRGELGPGEYYDVIAHSTKRFVYGVVEEPEKYGVPVRQGVENVVANVTVRHDETIDQVLTRYNAGLDPEQQYQTKHCVEITPVNANDFRICCKKCGKATAWNPKDLPGMEGAGADWTRKRWDDAVGG